MQRKNGGARQAPKLDIVFKPGFALGAATALVGALSFVGCGGGSDDNGGRSGLPMGKVTRAQVLRGRYIVTSVVACGDCHSGNQNLNASTWMAGFTPGTPGQSFPVGPFTTYAANLTPDKATGLGNWTAQQIFNALRTGKDADGKFLAPPMPWPVFRNMTDDDFGLSSPICKISSQSAMRFPNRKALPARTASPTGQAPISI